MTYPESITVKSADLAQLISALEARNNHFGWCDFRQKGSISSEGVKEYPCNCGFEETKAWAEEFYQRTLGDASRAGVQQGSSE